MTTIDNKTEEGVDLIEKQPYPEKFLFNDPGDTITGTLIDTEVGETIHGPAFILVLSTSEGERSVWMLGTVLDNFVRRRRPMRGDEITITYRGKTEGGSGRTYKDYWATCPRDMSKPIDYSNLLGQVEQPDLLDD